MKNICKNNSIFYILQILKRKYLSDANIALNVLQFYCLKYISDHIEMIFVI